jgi:diaminopimelate decarboxylase
MKPMGPIPPDFRAEDGRLLIGGQPADALAAQAGDTPLFVYDLAIVRRRVERFRAAFPGVALHYAVKANPYPPLVEAIADLVDGIDVASAGEMRLALASGMAAERISFAGPGKRDRELEEAIAAGVTLNLESEGEADRALATAARVGRRPRLAVRVNPDFELRGSGMKMGGGAKPFGVEADCCRGGLSGASHLRRVAGARCPGHHRGAGGCAGVGGSAEGRVRRLSAVGQSRRRLRHPLFPRRCFARC